jgi:fermentation-respiration switch protein FrsA (DUF1100 family)
MAEIKKINIPKKNRKLLEATIEGNKKEKGLVISYYGLFDSSENPSIIKVKNALVKAGYSVLSFDYIGHGKNKEDINKITMSKVMEDSYLVIDFAKKEHKNIFLLGFSFGAYPAIITAANKKVDGLLVFNPLTDFIPVALSKKSTKNLSKYGVKHEEVPLFTRIIFIADIIRYNIYNTAKKITCPVFAFHSLDDEIIPYQQTKKLESCIKSKKYFFYLPGENHPCDKIGLLEKRIIPEMVKWIRKN